MAWHGRYRFGAQLGGGGGFADDVRTLMLAGYSDAKS